MYGLRHKKLTSKEHAGSGSAGSSQSKRMRSRRLAERSNAEATGNIERSAAARKTKRSAAATENSERSAFDGRNTEKGNIVAARNNKRRLVAAGNTKKSVSDPAITEKRNIIAARNTKRSASATENIERSGSEAGNIEMTVVAGHPKRSGATTAHPERSGTNLENTERSGTVTGNVERIVADVGNTERSGGTAGNIERISEDGVPSRIVASEGVNSERTSAVRAEGDDCGRVTTDVNSQQNGGSGFMNSQLNGGSGGVNSNRNNATNQGCPSPPKRGRAKMCRTELKPPPRTGRVELEPVGHSHFKYVSYTPKGFKYPSQLGAILKAEYPGMIKVYDDNGAIVKCQPALSWNDYYWKRDRHGICYAKRVKAEFWSSFTCHPRHRARASKVLENYLVKRVTNMMYQVRLEGVKKFFNNRDEDCDDTRARTIRLTKEEYLTCRVEWCNKAVWNWLSKYWTSDRYMEKRIKAQEARMRCDDPAPNRGGSRNFTETQQFLEYTFGPEKSGVLNTYAVMKSGIKTVDTTGRSGPIRSEKAQKRLDDYKALVPDENSKKLDGKALYTMGDGAVEKVAVLMHARSRTVRAVSPDHYENVMKENEQLKDTNEILIEENSVHRELFMRMYADIGKEPPPDLLQRLAHIDARRHQANASHGNAGIHNSANSECDDDDHSWHEGDPDTDDELGGQDDDNIESDGGDDLESDGNDYLESDGDEDLQVNGEDSGSLEDDGSDTSDDGHYSDHVGLGDPADSMGIN